MKCDRLSLVKRCGEVKSRRPVFVVSILINGLWRPRRISRRVLRIDNNEPCLCSLLHNQSFSVVMLIQSQVLCNYFLFNKEFIARMDKLLLNLTSFQAKYIPNICEFNCQFNILYIIHFHLWIKMKFLFQTFVSPGIYRKNLVTPKKVPL